jgi:hypothetical protein
LGSSPADRRAAKQARRAENRAAWAAGEALPRWSQGANPGRTGPRTGPPAHPAGAEQRKAAKEARRAENRLAWAAARAERAEARRLARQIDRAERRAADRHRAAACTPTVAPSKQPNDPSKRRWVVPPISRRRVARSIGEPPDTAPAATRVRLARNPPAPTDRLRRATVPTVAWTLLAALGFWILRTMPRAKHRTVKALLVRAAAVLFLTAGAIGAGGWIGESLTWLVGFAGAIGGGLAWVLWLIGALSWLAGMVPEKWFRGDVPDWLSMSGLVLPSLLAAVPGPVGDAMTRAMTGVSDLVGNGMSSAFGIQA